MRTIKSLTRAKMADELKFEDSVQLAIKTIRQTPHSKLYVTPFPMHLGRKPRTALTILIDNLNAYYLFGKEHYVSAQPTELQVFTINDSEGEMMDYLVLNDTRKRGRSVSQVLNNINFTKKKTNLIQ